MKTKDFKVGDKIKIRNSIECRIMEITSNGWLKCCWMFHNRDRMFGEPKREMQIDSFRAAHVEKIIEREV